MTIPVHVPPAARFPDLLGLAAVLWRLKSGQYNDLERAAERLLFDDGDSPLPPDRTRGKSS